MKGVRVMANEKNLKPVRSTSEARKKGKAGGIKSGKVRAERKTLKEELLLLLAQGNTQNKMSLALLKKAMNGDIRAYEVIRDTVGEKPTDKIEQSGDLNNTITVKLEAVEKKVFQNLNQSTYYCELRTH